MLNISREDIPSEWIIERSVNDRFIKLPIVPYLKLLDNFMDTNVYENLNSPQIALINAANDPKYRFICAALARRLGKTFISNIIGQLVFLVPNCHVLIISPNYNLSSISFELQRKLITHFDLEVTRDNLKDKVIELSNGSTIRMGSISTVDSSVGRSYDLIIFDEAALSDGGEEAFNRSLRPTLDRNGAKAIFISTPRGKNNWFSRFFQRGHDPKYPEWVSIQADYSENTRMTESDVDEARRSISKAEFEQEYMASFVSFEGQIYPVGNDNIAEFDPLDQYEVIAGLDPGYRDPTAFVVIAYEHGSEIYWIVDEYLESQTVTSGHVEQLRELIDKWNIQDIFIDAAAAQFAADLAYSYDIATIKGKKDTLAGIALIQNLLEQGRLKIAPHCVETLKALDQYQWDTRETLTKEKPKHDHSHIPDAIRYAIHTFTV